MGRGRACGVCVMSNVSSESLCAVVLVSLCPGMRARCVWRSRRGRGVVAACQMCRRDVVLLVSSKLLPLPLFFLLLLLLRRQAASPACV
ncbi:hypothetical protein F5148DRAFT_1225213, partial [Russula earlei]